MHQLFDSEFLTAEYDPERDMIYLRRTPTPMPGPEELPELFSQLLFALSQCPGRPLLLDLRLGRGNNHPDFERAMKEQSLRLHTAFTNTVTLVRTPAGLLHVQRMARERGERSPRIFIDEAEALANLEAGR